MEEYIGVIKRPEGCESEHIGGHKDRIISHDPVDAALVVLVDMGMDYHKNERHWPQAIKEGSPWIVLKLGRPDMAQDNDPLWSRVSSDAHKDRLVVVTTVDDLRSNKGVEISRGLSWERTAEDCATALKGQKSPLAELAHSAAFIVVSFGPTGALLYDRQAATVGSQNPFTLIFDPQRLESSSDFRRQGKMWGYTSALTAAIARTLMDHLSDSSDKRGGKPRIKDGIRAGLRGMQVIYEEGFGQVHPPDLQTSYGAAKSAVYRPPSDRGGAREKPIQFPSKAAAEAIVSAVEFEEDGQIFAEASFAPSRSPSWTILTEKYNRFTCDLLDLARKVVVEGPSALHGSPWMKYGDLTTVDRSEIESLESVRALVADYAEKKERLQGERGVGKNKPLPPLSIAVFGAPGSGKSKAVTEVTNSINIPGIDFVPLTFNLSEFRSPEDLENSLHLVRDERLKGNIPLVFWDEFDAYFERSLGWLRFFLSPMQDGTFRAAEAIHPIGKAIFVFAGGTSDSLNTFQAQPNFVEAKGPDFLSRVRGSMELRGIDALHGDTDSDPHYVIRRAVLLNSILGAETSLLKEQPTEWQKVIDYGVLNAFLTVSQYRHGVRSMKAIVATSSLAGERHFGRSNLPAETQLNLHVDARDFRSKMQLE
ncbi:hypothetical protein [Streptomyces agglomeratus]|uniref:hypothetical protein n=1 Tax=Streptomyces agglomeratus TaxID=285458 RepID=UPI00159F0191|nr:hypothetical protein [Streptomyces agglomeratus]